MKSTKQHLQVDGHVSERDTLYQHNENICVNKAENKNQITASFTNFHFPRNKKHLQQSFWLGFAVIAIMIAVLSGNEFMPAKIII